MSSSLALITGASAAIALPPQIAVPPEINVLVDLLIFRYRPIIRPTIKVKNIEATVNINPSFLLL